MLLRSLIDVLLEAKHSDEFNLQTYIDLVSAEIDESESYEL